jgi:hypothetical protein
MQGEGGAAGAIQTGALSTTFTASQGGRKRLSCVDNRRITSLPCLLSGSRYLLTVCLLHGTRLLCNQNRWIVALTEKD